MMNKREWNRLHAYFLNLEQVAQRTIEWLEGGKNGVSPWQDYGCLEANRHRELLDSISLDAVAVFRFIQQKNGLWFSAAGELLRRTTDDLERREGTKEDFEAVAKTSGIIARALKDAYERQNVGNAAPKKYLDGWEAILDEIDLSDSPDERSRIRHLNDKYEGPLIVPGRGSKPKAEREKLIAWWNHLEHLWMESARRSADRDATTEKTHAHGRDGVVVPEISGSEKKRKQKVGKGRKT
ncbi:MAG: hypothetical protein AAF958_16645 [Planctomycetota bacterium]